MKLFLDLLFLSQMALSQPIVAPTFLDKVNIATEILCGEEPSTDAGKRRSESNLLLIEKNMGAALNQEGLQWCKMFNIIDRVDFFLRSQKSASFLNLAPLSVLDLVFKEKMYLTATSSVSTAQEESVDHTNNDLAGLIALQRHGFIQLQTLDESKVLENLLKANPADAQLIYQKWHRERKKNARSADQSGVTVKLPPFTIYDLETHDLKMYLQVLKKALERRYPVGIMARNSIPRLLEWIPVNNPAAADVGHALSVVGAGYINGVCQVRVRNTWGSAWQDNGSLNLPVHLFLNTILGTKSGQDQLSLNYIFPSPSFDQVVEKDEMTASGTIDYSISGTDLNWYKYTVEYLYKKAYRQTTGGEARFYLEKDLVFGEGLEVDGDQKGHYTGSLKDGKLIDGVLFFDDTSVVHFVNGRRRQYFDAFYSYEHKIRFSGSLSENGEITDGKLKFSDGSSIKFKNRKQVFYQNAIWNAEEKSRYTGSVRDDKPDSGTLAFPDGRVFLYKDGRRVDYFF